MHDFRPVLKMAREEGAGVKISVLSARWAHFLAFCVSISVMYPSAACAGEAEKTTYLGSDACAGCHEKEYLNFTTYARKSQSFESIERLRKGLTEQEIKGCYACHTTGYGRAGGFESLEKTPHLKNAGCEVCHGPGGLHVETQDPAYIKGKLSAEDCEGCHTSERVRAFRYKPLIHGGAH